MTIIGQKNMVGVSTVQVSDSVGSLLNSESYFFNSPAARWRLFAARLKLWEEPEEWFVIIDENIGDMVFDSVTNIMNRKRFKLQMHSLLYRSNFWIKSTWVRTIRRQQYLRRPNSSRASLSEYSAFNISMYESYLFPMTLPQVKHRTGMIILRLGCFHQILRRHV